MPTDGQLNHFLEIVNEMRFGMPDGDRKTQPDIAKLLGISQAYVSRIEKQAIGKLGDNLSEEDR